MRACTCAHRCAITHTCANVHKHACSCPQRAHATGALWLTLYTCMHACERTSMKVGVHSLCATRVPCSLGCLWTYAHIMCHMCPHVSPCPLWMGMDRSIQSMCHMCPPLPFLDGGVHNLCATCVPCSFGCLRTYAHIICQMCSHVSPLPFVDGYGQKHTNYVPHVSPHALFG